jgi:serine/threonine-protein kinase HipA
VLDLGCGTGSQTLVLAQELRTNVVAVDIHQPFLEELQQRAERLGLADLIETHCASMDAVEELGGAFDLMWCEGALYLLGVSRGLRLWRPLLATPGFAAFTELTWLEESLPAEAAAFWKTAYPAMSSLDGNLERARKAGFEPLDTFALPTEDWWSEYYGPLRERIAPLRPKAAEWPELATVLAQTEQEIAVFERHGASYGYVFYLLKKAGD